MELVKEWKNIAHVIETGEYYSGHIYKCLNGRNPHAYGFIWKYKDYVKPEVKLEEDEEFRNIGTYDGKDFSHFDISNYGKIKRAKKTDFCNITKQYKDYQTVDLVLNNNKDHYIYQIHYLVAHAFVNKDDENYDIVIHKDGNKLNNYYKNLEWTSVDEIHRKWHLEYVKNTGIFELWVPIKGYESYLISSNGRVKNKITGKILKNHLKCGYYATRIINKTFKIHRLVAQHFIYNSDPNHKKIVDHIDNNPLNNKVENLRWVTIKENNDYYHQHQKHTHIREKETYDIDKYNQIREDEIFKNIGVFEERDYSNYEVSNYGKIRSIKTNNLLTPQVRHGYLKICLLDMISSTTYQVNIHRLVAHVFVPGRTTEKNLVNHLDEDKLNNYYKNLEWCTNTENIQHSNGKKVQQIDLETGKVINTFNSVNEAQRTLNLKSTISIKKNCEGEYKHGYGYKWQYVKQ